EEADPGGVIGGVGMRRVKIAEERKGGGPPSIIDGVEVIGRAASASAGGERREREIGRRRTPGRGDVGGAGRPRATGVCAPEARAANPFGRVQVTAEAERLIVEWPQPFLSGVRRGEKGQPLQDRIALFPRGIEEDQCAEVPPLQRKGTNDPEL